MKYMGFITIFVFSLIQFCSNGFCSNLDKSNLFKIRLIEKSIEKYRADLGMYPSTKESLDSLLFDKDLSGWSGPYLKSSSLLKDTWGNHIVYLYPAKYGDKQYDLYSIGKNQIDNFGADDDISNWKGYDKWIYERKEMMTLTFIRSAVLFFTLSFVVYIIIKKWRKGG